MKALYLAAVLTLITGCRAKRELPVVTSVGNIEKQLFIDIHYLDPTDVSMDAVDEAHRKDLEVQDQFGVSFLQYWVDDVRGTVYCLAEATDSLSVIETHRVAHGLLPDQIFRVIAGSETVIRDSRNLFIDIHHFESGITARAVAEAHEKDLAVQDEFRVKFVNYYVDEDKGLVMCLAEAPDEDAVILTHEKAHGLLPDEVHSVIPGTEPFF